MPTTQNIAETDEGVLDLKGNELLLQDKTSGDPVAWRARSMNGGVFKLSMDAKINGQWVEIGYLFGKKDERYPNDAVGEFEFWHKKPGSGTADADYKKSLSIRHDGVVLPTTPAAMGEMWSPSGLYVTQQQDDGNFVTYRLSLPYDKFTPPVVAVWSAWSGSTGA